MIFFSNMRRVSYLVFILFMISVMNNRNYCFLYFLLGRYNAFTLWGNLSDVSVILFFF